MRTIAVESADGDDDVLTLPVDGMLPSDGRWYTPRTSLDNGTCLMARLVDGRVEIGSTLRSGVVSLDLDEWRTFVADVAEGAYKLRGGER